MKKGMKEKCEEKPIAIERAAILSNAIKQVKSLGVSVEVNAPIEGKMFW
jgi:hypothetical protein